MNINIEECIPEEAKPLFHADSKDESRAHDGDDYELTGHAETSSRSLLVVIVGYSTHNFD